jgi:S-disulfanyl-L-cysteine oxidoreductase SoxD
MKYTLVAVMLGTLVGAAQVSKTTKEGVYTAAQADRGKKAYLTACASCHQEGLQGADLAPPLKGDDFLVPWSSQSINDLFERVATTMPADAPGSLPKDVDADILAYVLQVNKFPAGTDELKPDPASLKAITIGKP